MSVVTLAQASTIVDTALKKGRDTNCAPLTVAVLDAGGHLVALLATDESYLKAERLTARDIKGVVSASGTSGPTFLSTIWTRKPPTPARSGLVTMPLTVYALASTA